jgi:hypothetical protein
MENSKWFASQLVMGGDRRFSLAAKSALGGANGGGRGHDAPLASVARCQNLIDFDRM